MATYLKRTSKLFDLSLIRTSANVNLRDLICPICRGILIEPVTLPCTHNLCLRCLKGTFEHNSLSCPLCRVRVGSWLRTATKSETLVNAELWELIRTRFPKEVEGKHNGDEGDIELDSGFASKKIILSAAGEIRREYEAQLQIAEEEMRREREAERLANEALIRKLRAEDEQLTLTQLAEDQSLAKSLAKKQRIGDKDKGAMKYYTEYGTKNSTSTNEEAGGPKTTNYNANSQCTSLRFENNEDKGLSNLMDLKKSETSNKPLNREEKNSAIGKIASSVLSKETVPLCQKPISAHNIVTRTLKHQAIGKFANSTNFIGEPSCSGTQVYGSRSKEELHVPIDILSRKKKILGVEVCVNQAENDERIGSAESAGSHDSINQEIHHFKPIKPIARTTLKMAQDGRPVDPKLIRVIPIHKRVFNAVPKPPSPTHIKRILGCSWSAFRGKARQNLELRRSSSTLHSDIDTDTKTLASQQSQRSSSKISKCPISESSKRLDIAPDLVSIDSNKNYAKGMNRLLNGARVSKKLILDEAPIEPQRTSRNKKISAPPGKNVNTSRGKKNLPNDMKALDDNVDNSSSSFYCSPEIRDSSVTTTKTFDNGYTTIENIAERTKRRKMAETMEKSCVAENSLHESREKRKTRNRNATTNKSNDDESTNNSTEISTSSKRKDNSKKALTKRRKIENDDSDFSKNLSTSINAKFENTNESSTPNTSYENSVTNDHIDEQIIEEQSRMERLILQEKKDFELAMRLQAQFDDMERIARRTRGSRKAMENVETNNFANRKIERLRRNTKNPDDASRECQNDKQRRRPQKHAVK